MSQLDSVCVDHAHAQWRYGRLARDCVQVRHAEHAVAIEQFGRIKTWGGVQFEEVLLLEND